MASIKDIAIRRGDAARDEPGKILRRRRNGRKREMENGKVKKVMKDRGFGFIAMVDGKEVFFHRSECRDVEFDSLEQGQEVGFELELVPKGPRARNVTRARAAH
jgi:CspA family cold shock protein